MSKRIDLLRLDYLFSVLLPCFVAIYFNNLEILNHLDILIGFVLLGISGNTLNDVIDSRDPTEIDTIKRMEGYHWKEVLTISIVSFILGTVLLIRTFQEHLENLLIMVFIIALVLFYCFKKNVPIFNQIILAVSHIILPYIIIRIDSNLNPMMSLSEIILIITIFFFAITGQIVHDVIDGDSIMKFTVKTQQLIVVIFSLITILFGLLTIILIHNLYFVPIICVPIGIIYTFRKPTRSSKGVKDTGIIIGNMILVYFIVLIII